MNIIYTTKIGDSPAAINRETSTLFINPKYKKLLTPFQWKFVIEHEKGHLYLDTDNELMADAYAFKQLAGTEFRSLKQCLGAISEVLPPDNPTRKQRYDALYLRALEWDAARGNKEAEAEFKRLLSANDNYFAFDLGSIIFGSKKNEADAEYIRAQADALGDRSDDASTSLNWSIAKNVMNTLLVIGVMGVIGYYFLIYKD